MRTDRDELANAILDMKYKDMMAFSSVLADVLEQVTDGTPLTGDVVAKSLSDWATLQNEGSSQ